MTDSVPQPPTLSCPEVTDEERRAVEVHKWYLSVNERRDVGWEFAFNDWCLHHRRQWREEMRRRHLIEMSLQRREIETHVWLRSQQAGRDLADEAREEWATLYAATWRSMADQQHIDHRDDPGHELMMAELQARRFPSQAWVRQIEVRNRLGLHVRPSMQLKKLIDRYPTCTVYVKNLNSNAPVVQIAEMYHLLALGAIAGDHLQFAVVGAQAAQVLNEVEDLFIRRFDEEFSCLVDRKVMS